MSTRFFGVLAAVVVMSAAAFGQFAEVKGTVKDEKGTPMVGARVVYTDQDTGRKYEFKTDKKGQYFSIGVTPGKFHIALLGPDGKEITYINTFIRLDPNATELHNVIDFDLKKMKEEQAQGAKGTVPNAPPQPTEAQKQEQAKIDAENASLKQLNAMMTEARVKRDAGDFAGAIGIMTQATKAGPDKHLLWYNLAEMQNAGAKAETDRVAQKAKYAQAAAAYKKGIDLAVATPDDLGKKLLPQYYNNYALALGKAGTPADALPSFEKAAQLDPANAAAYYFNEGAVAKNNNMFKEAAAAFEKVIAADPKRADAYYQKGSSLVNMATMGKDNKVTAPEGTAEAFAKYLELQPEGPYAGEAKTTLEFLGAKVDTSYKATKTATKKKN